MKRSLIFPIAGLLLIAAASILSCSKDAPTGVERRSISVEATPVFQRAGVSVYRIPGHAGTYAVRYQMFRAGDPSKASPLMTYAEAARTLDDATRVTPVVVWKEIGAGQFDRTSGVRGEVPRAATPVQVMGGGDPPDPCPCPCCAREGSVCVCSWGCLKVCYRAEETE